MGRGCHMRETNTSQESVQSGRQACCAYGGAWRCEGGCAPSRIVAESRLGPSLSAGTVRRSVLPAKEGRPSSRESVRSSARRADPRGQRRGVRRAARQAAASRRFPRETRRGCGGLGVAGGRRGERSLGTAGGGRRGRKQAANPFHHPDLGGTSGDTSTSNLESATPHRQFAGLPDGPTFALY